MNCKNLSSLGNPSIHLFFIARNRGTSNSNVTLFTLSASYYFTVYLKHSTFLLILRRFSPHIETHRHIPKMFTVLSMEVYTTFVTCFCNSIQVETIQKISSFLKDECASEKNGTISPESILLDFVRSPHLVQLWLSNRSGVMEQFSGKHDIQQKGKQIEDWWKQVLKGIVNVLP